MSFDDLIEFISKPLPKTFDGYPGDFKWYHWVYALVVLQVGALAVGVFFLLCALLFGALFLGKGTML